MSDDGTSEQAQPRQAPPRRRGLPVVAASRIVDTGTLDALRAVRNLSTAPEGDCGKRSVSRARRERRKRSKAKAIAGVCTSTSGTPPRKQNAAAYIVPDARSAPALGRDDRPLPVPNASAGAMQDMSRFASPEFTRLLSNSTDMADATIRLAAAKAHIPPRKMRKLLARKGIDVSAMLAGDCCVPSVNASTSRKKR